MSAHTYNRHDTLTEVELLCTADERRIDRETEELIEELRAAEFEEKGSSQ